MTDALLLVYTLKSDRTEKLTQKLMCNMLLYLLGYVFSIIKKLIYIFLINIYVIKMFSFSVG